MSYMDSNAVFADGIQELSFDEVEKVSGAAWSWGGVAAAAGTLSLAAGGAAANTFACDTSFCYGVDDHGIGLDRGRLGSQFGRRGRIGNPSKRRL